MVSLFTSTANSHSEFSQPRPYIGFTELEKAHADISSAAAEIYAAATAVNDILMVQYVCDEMGMGFQLPFILQVDNQAACSTTARCERLANDGGELMPCASTHHG